MPALLFEGNEDWKFYTADPIANTITFIVQNHETDATHVHSELCLSLDELIVLDEWIDVQIRVLEKNTKK